MSENAQTPEAVALELLKIIAEGAGKATPVGDKPILRFRSQADSKWVLDTYAECLLAVKAPGKRMD